MRQSRLGMRLLFATEGHSEQAGLSAELIALGSLAGFHRRVDDCKKLGPRPV